jgi:hypothetical protein
MHETRFERRRHTMSDPIRGPGPNRPEGPSPTDGAGQTSQADGAYFAGLYADASQGTSAPASAAASEGLEPLIQRTAQRLHSGQIDMGEAIEEVIDGAVDARFAHLKPELRARMSEDLAEVFFSDAYFILELEATLKRAVDNLP